MRLSKFAALMCCVLLLGCSSDDSDNNGAQADFSLPHIGAVYTHVDHYHPTYWTKFNPPSDVPVEPEEQIGLMLGFEIQVRYLSGLSNLAEIFVSNPSENSRWDVPLEPVNLTEEQPLDSLVGAEFGTDNQLYEHSLQRVVLDGYEVTAVDRKGNRTTKHFAIEGFNSGAREGREFVYSDEYKLSKLKGMKAMEAMSIAENGLSFESDAENETFTIGFTHRDGRARNYKIEFYDSYPARNLIGTVGFNSPSIVNEPLVFSRRTILELPYSEVVLEDGALIENVEGIHIVLTDEQFEREIKEEGMEEQAEESPQECSEENPEQCPEVKWAFNYSGYSEFVTLPVPPME